MKKLLAILAMLMPLSALALDIVNNFRWQESNNRIEIAVGEPYQLKYSCSDNSLPFTNAYAKSWVHLDFAGGQHVVNPPVGYSIDEKGVITGLVPGSYAIHPTGWVQSASGVNDWLYITVVTERTEKESNNTMDTANEVISKIRFGLYNTSDMDYFKYTNNNLKFGDIVTFKIHYEGYSDSPFGYRWATFCAGDIVGGGSLILQDQECKALVTYEKTVYLEVYYDQSCSQYFKYGEEFVAEVYVNGEPVGGKEEQEETNTLNGHEYVDLGLPSGKCWATKNYGSDTPEGYGAYLEWKDHGIISSSWGNEWTTPSLDDIRELENNCTWTWGTMNGHNGYTVTGKNGKSIFLPASGCMMMEEVSARRVGDFVYYWTSTKSGDMASIILCTEAYVWYGEMNTLFSMLPIRPVTSAVPSGISIPSDNSNEIIGVYDLQGNKLEGPTKGINIIRFKDGSSRKIMK